MNTDQIKMKFDMDYVGEMVSPTGKVKLGDQLDGMLPYHLLYGALGACFYATFLSIAVKMKLAFDDVEIQVSGTKREQTPPTLDYVKIEMIICNPSAETRLKKAAELGARHCSIHEMISKVATIELVVLFKDKQDPISI